MSDDTTTHRKMLADAYRNVAAANNEPFVAGGNRRFRPSDIAQEIEDGTETGMGLLEAAQTLAEMDGDSFEVVCKKIAQGIQTPSPG